jgi:replicative DNA helicase
MAAGHISELPIHIDDNATQTVSSIISKSRQLKRKGGIDMIIVDHLGLMAQDKGQKTDSRNNDLAIITRGLKRAAKMIGVPVIILSQLSRNTEHRQDHRPILGDLRDSGAIEQDADIVLFVYRDEQYNPKPENHGKAEIIIGKQRNGPVGTIPIRFINECAKFKNTDENQENSHWSDK